MTPPPTTYFKYPRWHASYGICIHQQHKEDKVKDFVFTSSRTDRAPSLLPLRFFFSTHRKADNVKNSINKVEHAPEASAVYMTFSLAVICTYLFFLHTSKQIYLWPNSLWSQFLLSLQYHKFASQQLELIIQGLLAEQIYRFITAPFPFVDLRSSKATHRTCIFPCFTLSRYLPMHLMTPPTISPTSSTKLADLNFRWYCLYKPWGFQFSLWHVSKYFPSDLLRETKSFHPQKNINE